MNEVLEYWSSGRGLGDITPKGKPWPEGDGFPAFLAALLDGEKVVEIGCGIGRLAGIFPPDSYYGLDICAEAVARARESHPEREFRVIEPWDAFPLLGTAALLHTVLLHVPDDALPGFIRRLVGFDRVIVGEILGRSWRRSGEPPVFNRERREYEAAFGEEGFRLFATHEIDYPHYRDTHLTILDFRAGAADA